MLFFKQLSTGTQRKIRIFCGLCLLRRVEGFHATFSNEILTRAMAYGTGRDGITKHGQHNDQTDNDKTFKCQDVFYKKGGENYVAHIEYSMISRSKDVFQSKNQLY